MKRVIISGGGTGGHIYPAITIAKAMAELEPTEILYVGTKNGLESTLIPKEGIPFMTLDIKQGLQRKLSWQNVITIEKAVSSIWKASAILKKFDPHIVVGTGGYVCGPMLMAAAMHRIPTLIQEQNVIPGITNTILSKFATVVAVGYEEAKGKFGGKESVVVTGNPVRKDILTATKEEGCRQLGIRPDVFTVLVAGGSRGARTINTAMVEVHHYFKNDEHIQILHVTGSNEFERVKEELKEVGDDGWYGKSSCILPYLYNMPAALAAADLAVFRAGAVGLAELTVRGVPAILIPYPYAAEDHQTYNAQALVHNGAAKMIVDKMLTAKELIQEFQELRNNPEVLQKMSLASRKMGRPEAAYDIARLAFSIAKK